jgi:hypothetical protein
LTLEQRIRAIDGQRAITHLGHPDKVDRRSRRVSRSRPTLQLLLVAEQEGALHLQLNSGVCMRGLVDGVSMRPAIVPLAIINQESIGRLGRSTFLLLTRAAEQRRTDPPPPSCQPNAPMLRPPWRRWSGAGDRSPRAALR